MIRRIGQSTLAVALFFSLFNHNIWCPMTITNKISKPISLIIDTDMGNDIDDALALALCYSLERQGRCVIHAITTSKDNIFSPVYIDILNHFYGRESIPIGMVNRGVTKEGGKYAPQVAAIKNSFGKLLFARKISPDDPPEDAVKVLRRTLAQQPENSVVIVMIGFSTNMARLLQTEPDEHSPLSGRLLFERKVKFVSAMAADFSKEVQENPTLENREYNIHRDIFSAMYFFSNCPAPIVFTGYELGCALPYPAKSIEMDFGWAPYHPVVEAYKFFDTMPYDRPSWDLVTVYYAVCGGNGFFSESAPGIADVNDDGIVLFRVTPQGNHRYLELRPGQKTNVVATFCELCSRPTTVHAKRPRSHMKVLPPKSRSFDGKRTRVE
jgi:inosine-uridine nucleoside N-ribohydrolase